MPDFLTAAQRTRFASSEWRMQDFAITGKFVQGLTEHELAGYINKWGETECELNYHPRDRGDIAFPLFSIELANGDGRFSRGTSTSIWTDPITAWEFVFSITESISTGSPVTLVNDVTFRVYDAQPRKDRTCLVTCVHPLWLYWNATWKREGHRHETNWNAKPHAVSL